MYMYMYICERSDSLIITTSHAVSLQNINYLIAHVSCKGKGEGGDTAGMGTCGKKRGKVGRLSTVGR